MKTVLVTINTPGSETGPNFDIFSDVDLVTPLASSVAKTSLISGYSVTTVPDAATSIRVKSIPGTCSTYVDLPIVTSTTTTTTTLSPIITGNLCGAWTSYVYPNPDNTENRIDGYIDFSSKINGETIDPVNSSVRVTSFITLNGGGSTIPNDGSGDLTFNEFNNRGYISEASIVVFQVDDPSAAMTLYFGGYITTYEGTTYSLSDAYSDYTGMNGNNTFNQCPII